MTKAFTLAVVSVIPTICYAASIGQSLQYATPSFELRMNQPFSPWNFLSSLLEEIFSLNSYGQQAAAPSDLVARKELTLADKTVVTLTLVEPPLGKSMGAKVYDVAEPPPRW